MMLSVHVAAIHTCDDDIMVLALCDVPLRLASLGFGFGFGVVWLGLWPVRGERS
jgi:hypothetical protein